MADHIDKQGKFGPVSKAATGGMTVSSALVVLILFFAQQLDVEMEPAVAGAIVALVGAIVTAISAKFVSPEKTIDFQREQGNLPDDVDYNKLD